mmetsp:Transcript_20381/g.64350  ORF Transcript_20381/g.64350 Transcript_20381/m.64350 type:complete len:239 (-) Transcript_20381:1008-1724(-)
MRIWTWRPRTRESCPRAQGRHEQGVLAARGGVRRRPCGEPVQPRLCKARGSGARACGSARPRYKVAPVLPAGWRGGLLLSSCPRPPGSPPAPAGTPPAPARTGARGSPRGESARPRGPRRGRGGRIQTWAQVLRTRARPRPPRARSPRLVRPPPRRGRRSRSRQRQLPPGPPRLPWHGQQTPHLQPNPSLPPGPHTSPPPMAERPRRSPRHRPPAPPARGGSRRAGPRSRAMRRPACA